MSRRALLLLTLALAAMLLPFRTGPALAGPGDAGAAARPVRIAALYNSSGDMEGIDLPGLNGARLKAEEINAAGGLLGGRPVELVAIDTRTDEALAGQAARRVLAEGVSAAIGYADPGFAAIAGRIFQAAGVPFVSSGSGQPDLPGRIGEFMFTAAPSDCEQAAAVAEFAGLRLEARSVVVWTDDDLEQTRAMSACFRQALVKLGGELPAQESFRSGQTDFTHLINRLRALHPDAVFLAAVPPEAGYIVRQIRAAGLTLPILGGDGLDAASVILTAGRAMSGGVYFATHAFRAERRPEVAAFVRAYAEAYQVKTGSAYAALGYDALGLVAGAVERAGTDEPGAVAKALAATRHYPGVCGDTDFRSGSRVPVKPIAIVGIKNGSFFPAWTRLPAPEPARSGRAVRLQDSNPNPQDRDAPVRTETP